MSGSAGRTIDPDSVITLEMAQLDPVAEHTTAIGGNTYRRRDGSPSHW